MPQDESVSASLIRRSDLPDVGIMSLTVPIDGEMTSIIVKCEGQEVRAWLNVCPHQGRRLDYVPGKFLIDKQNLVCPAHGASFRLADGFCTSGPCRGESLRSVSIRQSESGELQFRTSS